MSVSVLDIIIFVILIASGIVVCIKGFFAELGDKASYFIGFFISMMFTRRLAYFVGERLEIKSVLLVCLITFLVLFYVGFFLCRILASVLTKAIEGVKLTIVNKILGFFLGILEAFVIITLIIYVLRFQTLFDIKSMLDKSLIYNYVLSPIYSWISNTTVVTTLTSKG